MKIYYKEKQWKLLLFIIAIMIGATSLLYTNYLVERLDQEEQKKIELWAKATTELANSGMGPVKNILATRIIQENTTIPIILSNDDGEIIGSRNLSKKITEKPEALLERLEKMKSEHEPIKIKVEMGGEIILIQSLYYEDSYLLKQIQFYPILQLLVIFLFVLVSYIAFNKSRKSEQNQVWAGMAKETAHQIGTPLSSIMAWVDILKENDSLKNITYELDKDISRLETITDRFSKIGSKTKLESTNISKVIEDTIKYLKHRLSNKVEIIFKTSNRNVQVPLNKILFEWVIENICKNSVDAMSGSGKIIIDLIELEKNINIYIIDTGKGIQKNIFKSIFKPGFTSKKRGWGLGLSLSKRIIEDYHFGEIYIESSVLKKGTTLCVSIPKI